MTEESGGRGVSELEQELSEARDTVTDVNLDGRINVGDANFVKAHAGSPEARSPVGTTFFSNPSPR